MIARAAAELHTGVDAVRAAWRSLGEQMQAQAREAVRDGLLTNDYVDEAPPALIIGLPASVLLGTIERSPSDDELVLASGLTISRYLHAWTRALAMSSPPFLPLPKPQTVLRLAYAAEPDVFEPVC